jgi:hypothetical protein
MEGMVCKKICGIQEAYSLIEGTHTSAPHWMTGLILKLLQTAHGQWLYRNIQVHIIVTGTQATLRKEHM